MGTVADKPLHPTWCNNEIAAWIVQHGGVALDSVSFLGGLCTRFVDSGVPLWRVSCGIPTLHPELFVRNIRWHRGRGAEEILRPHGIERSDTFRDNPFAALLDGAGGFRRRLDAPEDALDYPLLRELKGEGGTDYVIMPLVFSTGQVNYISWTTDRAGGFETADLTLMYDLLPLIALRLEIEHAYNLGRTLLKVYLGEDSAEQVLAGTVKRAQGTVIRAAIWYCDLRGFTRMTEVLPQEKVIRILNDYFETMAEPVTRRGGEILKFMGDGMLAIFKFEDEDTVDACCRAMEAALDAQVGLDVLNRTRREHDLEPLRVGISLHLGDVVWGNIGARQRLDFTVIGRAVNEVARMDALCASLGYSLLTSESFAASCQLGDLVSIGKHRLDERLPPRELYTRRTRGLAA